MDDQARAAMAALKVLETILGGGDQAAPVGSTEPPERVAERMAASAATPEGQAALAAAATGGRQTERARYEVMDQHELAALSADEFRRALSLIKGP